MQREIKERPFKDWVIGIYRAQSPDGKYKFWIANGFLFFQDEGREQLLSQIGILTRYKIWKKIKEEILLRIDEIFK